MPPPSTLSSSPIFVSFLSSSESLMSFNTTGSALRKPFCRPLPVEIFSLWKLFLQQMYSMLCIQDIVPSTLKTHTHIPDKNKQPFYFLAFFNLYCYSCISAKFYTERKLAAKICLHFSCIFTINRNAVFCISFISTVICASSAPSTSNSMPVPSCFNESWQQFPVQTRIQTFHCVPVW